MRTEHKLHMLASLLFLLATLQVAGVVWTVDFLRKFQSVSVSARNTATVVDVPVRFPTTRPSAISLSPSDTPPSGIVVHFVDEASESKEIAAWTLSTADHPEWYDDTGGISKHLNREVALLVERSMRNVLPRASHAVVRSVVDDGVVRATIVGTPADGYDVDARDVVARISAAVRANAQQIVVPVYREQGSLLVQQGAEKLWLQRLSTGASDFTHSPLGRAANVEKAITEKIHGIVVPSGETFSFNAAMGPSIDGRNGWSNSLVIMNGKDLVEAPGGGICQAATTTLRAAVLAGLPIEQRANHSLFVGYYEEHGVGLDAAVFPKKQDFTFVNDFESDIILVGRVEGTSAYVDVYGLPDGRRVTLQGPFFAKGSPFSGKPTPLQRNEIGWTQFVRYADGTNRSHALISRYSSIPKRLTSQFIAAKTVTRFDEM